MERKFTVTPLFSETLTMAELIKKADEMKGGVL